MAYEGLINSTSFAGHESFPLRFAWLKKGYDKLAVDHAFFSDKDAMVELGVGKNMVRSIRHWGLACGVWEEEAGHRGRLLQPTEPGLSLLDDNGWDPYLEDPGTLWWLHWSLVRNPDRATIWTYLFGIRGGVSRLSRDQLVSELDRLQGQVPGRQTPRSSLKRDVDVLARSYIRDSGRRRSFEDALDAPLAELGLMRRGPTKGTIDVLVGDWPTLPLGIFEAALADYWKDRGATTISISELLYGDGSPGRAFRLTEGGLIRRLVALRDHGWGFDESASEQSVAPPVGLKAHHALARHYEALGQRGEAA